MAGWRRTLELHCHKLRNGRANWKMEEIRKDPPLVASRENGPVSILIFGLRSSETMCHRATASHAVHDTNFIVAALGNEC